MDVEAIAEKAARNEGAKRAVAGEPKIRDRIMGCSIGSGTCFATRALAKTSVPTVITGSTRSTLRKFELLDCLISWND